MIRAPRLIAFASLILIVGLAGGWALTTLLSPPRPPAETAAYSLYEAAEGDVSSTIALNTAAEWRAEPSGVNLATGTVTKVRLESGALVSPGTAVYTVNLRPTVVARGKVPAFRALQRGMVGPDVEQLQRMLAAAGVYSGEAGGTFDGATAEAVRRWQHKLGVSADGVVQAGDVIFVPRLPARLALDTETLYLGAQLSGGELVMSVLPTEPVFTIPVTEGQAALAPEGTRVEIEAPDGSTWQAFVTGVRRSDGEVELLLGAPAGGSICGTTCGAVPVTEQTLLPSTIYSVEEISGIVVPTAALRTDPAGDVIVIDEEGAELPVDVRGSARGMSAVDGIPSGTLVRVPPRS